MHDMIPLLKQTDFPRLKRGKLETLQVNMGYTCNQSCLHCHVNAGPTRKEQISEDTLEAIFRFLRQSDVETVDITGGAPEIIPGFRELVVEARKLGKRVIDRSNLTVLELEDQVDLAEFLAAHQVEITASLPCYLQSNVDAQRGKGVYSDSIRALRRLNALGYAKKDSGLLLNLVYNPVGEQLPPAQCALEADYKRELSNQFGVEFNQLFTLANMPIARFGSTLVSHQRFEGYMALLHSAHNPENLKNVMCRTLISIDYRGYVYDCDFNQMLNLPLWLEPKPRTHIRDLDLQSLEGNPIAVGNHCYGCTAGQGSSCGGALAQN